MPSSLLEEHNKRPAGSQTWTAHANATEEIKTDGVKMNSNGAKKIRPQQTQGASDVWQRSGRTAGSKMDAPHPIAPLNDLYHHQDF